MKIETEIVSKTNLDFKVKTKDFELLTSMGRCHPTDDSIMSLAVAKAILDCNGDYSGLEQRVVSCMQKLGRK